MRKGLIAFIICSILLVVVYAFLSERHSPEVNGSFLPEDLAAVKRLARKEQQHQFCERLSLGIRQRKTAVLREAWIALRPDYALRSISQNPDRTVVVTIGITGLHRWTDVYEMRKTEKGWQIIDHFKQRSWPTSEDNRLGGSQHY